MYIKNIKLKNFRNYSELDLDFDKNINIIYGNNAQGKTNILEAIYLCALGKSFRTTKYKELINFKEDFTNVEVTFSKNNRDFHIKFVISNGKVVFVNGIKLAKLSELLSNLNIVLFSPDDIDIINGSPARRRKFLNVLISQLKPNYMYLLNKYNRILEQRNATLKFNKNIDMQTLDIWDESVAEYSFQIYKYRKHYIDILNKEIKQNHFNLTNGKEEFIIKYISSCSSKEEILRLLLKNRQNDIKRAQTSIGIHKDDLIFNINEQDLKLFGSQGQKRFAILSLKVAELSTFFEETGEKPILLLDDFMSELDSFRIKSFIKKISDMQVLITCTDCLKLDFDSNNPKLINVNNGKIKNEGVLNGKSRS